MKDISIKQKIYDDKIVFKVIDYQEKKVKNIIIERGAEVKVFRLNWVDGGKDEQQN